MPDDQRQTLGHIQNMMCQSEQGSQRPRWGPFPKAQESYMQLHPFEFAARPFNIRQLEQERVEPPDPCLGELVGTHTSFAEVRQGQPRQLVEATQESPLRIEDAPNRHVEE